MGVSTYIVSDTFDLLFETLHIVSCFRSRVTYTLMHALAIYVQCTRKPNECTHTCMVSIENVDTNFSAPGQYMLQVNTSSLHISDIRRWLKSILFGQDTAHMKIFFLSL